MGVREIELERRGVDISDSGCEHGNKASFSVKCVGRGEGDFLARRGNVRFKQGICSVKAHLSLRFSLQQHFS